MHLSQQDPDGNMRVCCTANVTVGATNDKKHGGQVGVLKTAEGVFRKLKQSRFNDSMEQ